MSDWELRNGAVVVIRIARALARGSARASRHIAILVGLLLPNAVRWTVVLATSLSGSIFSAYLFAVQALELHAFCTWCLASDVLITALAALSATALFTDEPRRQRSSRNGLAS